MPVEDNTMKLGEFQNWAERGGDLKDASAGLLFHACDLATKTNSKKDYYTILIGVAAVTALLYIGEQIGNLQK